MSRHSRDGGNPGAVERAAREFMWLDPRLRGGDDDVSNGE
jgi:hypothetical protein